MSNYQSKKQLGITDNKSIIIESIKGINIKNFRLISNQEFNLGKQITIVSGRNGTMKSTIMGLVAHPFETDEKSITGEKMSTSFSEVFKLSLTKDKQYEYDIKMDINHNNETKNLIEPVKMYNRSNRFRLVPSGSEKGDGFFNLPSVYINLKRLYPLVAISDEEIRELNIEYNDKEKEFISKFYERIFAKTEFSTFQTYETDSNSVHKNPIGPGTTASYDITSISSGEDNLSAFVKILISFMRVFQSKSDAKQLTGLLSIDEFEASLHPIAQLNLFNFLLEWSRNYNVQILLNTHSLYLIQEVMKMETRLNNKVIRINFITKRFSDHLEIYSNPQFKFAKEELTLTRDEYTETLSKVTVLCEDQIAEQYIKQIAGRDISKRCNFITNVTGETGSSWKTLKSLAKNGFTLLSDARALIIFDADIIPKDIGKTKFDKILYLPSITENKLPLEKEIVNYILNLPDNHDFFKKFSKTKGMFCQSFTEFNISLTTDKIKDEKVDYYKNWFNSIPKKETNKYRNYMIKDNHKIFDEFKLTLKNKINEVFEENGIPTIE
ncbi:AAA family ATPase [Streptococcus plurextorum]|uniref:AAA family ATPase n=1 Tax=Streptococcus plurextorum TaxID=456876 RepID=UPI00041E42F5|nr:AAA family ATPase [Streptococcus plurextorum]